MNKIKYGETVKTRDERESCFSHFVGRSERNDGKDEGKS